MLCEVAGFVLQEHDGLESVEAVLQVLGDLGRLGGVREDGDQRLFGDELEARELLLLLVELVCQISFAIFEFIYKSLEVIHAVFNDGGLLDSRVSAHVFNHVFKVLIHLVEPARGLVQVRLHVRGVGEDRLQLHPVLLQLVELGHECVDCLEFRG